MAVWVVREKWSVWIGAVWVGVRNEVCGSELCGSEWEMKWWEGGSEKWGWSAREMSRLDCFHEWIRVRNGKRKLTVHRVCVREVRQVRIGIEKWVDRSLELLCSMCGSFSWSSVCGSELVKLCVHVKELYPVHVRELSGKCLKWKWGLNWFSACFALFYGQTENIFSLTQFTKPTKHAIFRKMVSKFRLKSKQTDP